MYSLYWRYTSYGPQISLKKCLKILLKGVYLHRSKCLDTSRITSVTRSTRSKKCQGYTRQYNVVVPIFFSPSGIADCTFTDVVSHIVCSLQLGESFSLSKGLTFQMIHIVYDKLIVKYDAIILKLRIPVVFPSSTIKIYVSQLPSQIEHTIGKSV